MIRGRWKERGGLCRGGSNKLVSNGASTKGRKALGSLEAGWGITQLQMPTKTRNRGRGVRV